MSKSTVVGIVIVVVLLAGGGALWVAHNNSDKTTSSTMGNMNPTSSSDNGSSSQATATNSVTIQDFAFSPANITVKKGTTVTWTNKDSVAHTVTETDGQNGPQSDDIAPGKTFVFTFDNPGTYKYRCSIHTEMTGTVTVTE